MSTLHRALTTSSTATAFTAQIPTTTEPSGTGKFDLTDYMINGRMPTHIRVFPFGTDAANETFDFRIWGWNASEDGVYIPTLLIDVSAILGDIDAAAIATNTKMADTLTVNDGPADNGPWRSVVDAQEELVASVTVSTLGCRYISFDWDSTGTASQNAYWLEMVI